MTSEATSRVVIKGFVPPAEGKAVRVDANGVAVAVFSVGGSLFAIGAKCTHVGGPLDKGSISGHRVTCPLHGSVFDIETGAVLRGPAAVPEPAYRAHMDGQDLVLEPRPQLTGTPAGH